MSKEGYTLDGWSETADGMAVTLPYSMPLNGKTLYAVWGINQYTVTFNANGATGDTPAPITADYNSVVTLSGVGGMSKEGYTFGGWSEASDGTAVTLPYRMPLDGDILYAIWISPSPATLSFDLNGGSGNVPPINGYTGTIVALPSGSGATRQGYTFLGWSAYPDGEILPTSYMITGNATIYAVWTVNQYILDFLPNGAEGSPSTIYADYDSEVTLPGVGDMSKVGYTFGGWSETVDGTAVTLPYRMPFGGGSLYAVWNINQYRITWNWTTEAGPQTITEDLDYDTYPVKTVPGYQTETDVFTFSTWSPDTEPVSADATYTAQYTSVPRQYNVTWYVDGDGTTTAVAFGAVISLPNDPTKTGYTFGGWSPALPATMPANDISVTATWTINRYTVTFDPNGATGEVPAPITADYNSEVTLPGVGSLVLTGYIFEGWSETSDGAVISGTYRMPSGDKTLYASWVLDQCTLTFNANGASSGTVPSSITKSYGLEVTLPSLVDLSKIGHTFGGWSLIADGTAIESPYTMTGNVTLYAVWNINKYTLSFNANGAEGTAPPSSDNDYNSVVTLPTAGSLHKTGHSFSGWSETAEGEAVTEPYTMPLGGKTLYAVWTVNQYTITFVSDGSTVPAITQDYGTAITSPAAPTKTGYTFDEWSPALPNTMPAENILITAQWNVNQYTITFDTAGGSAVASIPKDYGAAVTAPAAPTKEGYTFGGWSPALPNTMPANDFAVIATWTINQYTITFDTAGGSAVPAITQDYGTAITSPAAPTRTGYTFGGWSPALPATMPGANTTLTAQWTVNQYTITFDTAGGSAVPAITQDYGTTVTSPTAPTRTGYTFGGWSPALPATMPAANTTATAQWTINQYTISFSANGATGAVPVAITGDYDSTVSLPEAGSLAKAGYAFGGWSHNPGGSTLLTPYKVNTDETLYAVWNIITYDELPDSEVISDIISQDDEPVLQVKGNAADQVLDNTIFQSIGDKSLTVDVVDDEGQVQYSWTFEGDYKSEPGTFKAGISEVTPEGDLSGAITSTGAENPLVLNFAASGELPINATVKYYVGDKYENGTKLTLFFYNETTKQLEEKAKDLVVTDGWVTLSLTHCSSYVLAEPAPASTPEDSTMLYIGIGAAAAAILGAVAFFIIRRR